MPSYQRERYPIIAVKARPAVENQSNAAEDVMLPPRVMAFPLLDLHGHLVAAGGK
jgi:hypothetical protein